MQIEIPTFAGVPLEFLLFACVLAGVALLHRHSLRVAVLGLAAITVYKLAFSSFAGAAGLAGLGRHVEHEWVLVANLFALIVGFALLARHFEESRLPLLLPRYLPDDWKGGFMMLVAVFVLSSFLDNIAAAMIGGTMATALFRGRVHVGFLAAIVAASNAGGAGSVVGDTTTTMMWIAGVSPAQVFEAYVAGVPALLIFGIVAARQQHAWQPIVKDAPAGVHVDAGRLAVVAAILVRCDRQQRVGQHRPRRLARAAAAHRPGGVGGAAGVRTVRAARLEVLPSATRGAVFLVSLVLAASMMPVEALPAASWQVALGLGFVSAVFDNIPLTALALKPGRLRLGLPRLRGRLRWLDDLVRFVGRRRACEPVPAGALGRAWLAEGWHVPLAYVIGFACCWPCSAGSRIRRTASAAWRRAASAAPSVRPGPLT